MKIVSNIEKLVILKNQGSSTKPPKPILIDLNVNEKTQESAENLFEFTSDSRWLVLRNSD